jgi:hypothetical protein
LDVVLRDNLKLIDFFDALKFLARNTVGREIAWDYYRNKYQEIDGVFGFENQAVGQLLIDISSTFENEFLFFEVCSRFDLISLF